MARECILVCVRFLVYPRAKYRANSSCCTFILNQELEHSKIGAISHEKLGPAHLFSLTASIVEK